MIDAVRLLQTERIEFNVLCVVSKANVSKARELFQFFRKLSIDYLQFIPLAEFHPDGSPMPFTITVSPWPPGSSCRCCLRASCTW